MVFQIPSLSKAIKCDWTKVTLKVPFISVGSPSTFLGRARLPLRCAQRGHQERKNGLNCTLVQLKRIYENAFCTVLAPSPRTSSSWSKIFWSGLEGSVSRIVPVSCYSHRSGLPLQDLCRIVTGVSFSRLDGTESYLSSGVVWNSTRTSTVEQRDPSRSGAR